jgi:hypothetical protein
MNKIKTTAMASLASTMSPEASRAQEAYFFTEQNPAQRYAKTTFHRAISRNPGVFGRMLGVRFREDWNPAQFPYVGNGFDSLVLRDGDDVVKIIQRSLGLSETDKHNEAVTRQTEHDVLKSYLNGIVLGHTVSVAPHPYIDRTALQTRQPFLPHAVATNLFADRATEMIPKAAERMQANYPEAWEELGKFVDSGFALYDEQALVPDTAGAGNLVVNSGEFNHLTLIDGQPISIRNRPIQEVSLRQLEAIGNAVG